MASPRSPFNNSASVIHVAEDSSSPGAPQTQPAGAAALSLIDTPAISDIAQLELARALYRYVQTLERAPKGAWLDFSCRIMITDDRCEIADLYLAPVPRAKGRGASR